MDSRYIHALEQRLQWAKWANRSGNEAYYRQSSDMTIYKSTLWQGETFFMNSRFCQLVDYARKTIPDDLVFEKEWVPTRSGWMLMEEPFEVPRVHTSDADGLKQVTPRVSAIGWTTLYDVPKNVYSAAGVIRPGAVVCCCFQDMDLFGADIRRTLRPDKPAYQPPERLRGGFGMWSHFALQSGEKVLERVRACEKFFKEDGEQGIYDDNRATDMLHEIRWIYTAMHLMSEKLAATVEHRADRHARKRLEREKFAIEPAVKLITLRRMEEHRAVEHRGEVDWHWQWHVQGHWRNQWYAKEQTNKLKWIEEYVKGPADKPLKPATPILYKVER